MMIRASGTGQRVRDAGNLNNAGAVTDVALQQMVNFVKATSAIAATVKLTSQGQREITNLVGQMNVVSDAIKNDQRFHTALQIGKALAANMNSLLGEA
jgi:hypothetical protein